MTPVFTSTSNAHVGFARSEESVSDISLCIENGSMENRGNNRYLSRQEENRGYLTDDLEFRYSAGGD